MVFSIKEIFDIVLMTLAVGYIFMDFFKRYVDRDPLTYYSGKRFDTAAFKLAILVTAPSIILHEFGHKFVAIFFGLNATFNAAYFWLFIGIFLKAIGSSFIFFVPAFVSFSGATALQALWIGVSGPLVNLVIFLLCLVALKQGKVPQKYFSIISLTKKINLFLFVFNMIPIPGFDGFHFFRGLLGMF